LITIEDIEKAMEKWEIDVDQEELLQIMKQHDKDQDNEIDFDEFI